MKKTLLFFLLIFFSSLSLVAQTIILDFETETTTRNFQYFGSTLEGTLSNIIENPDPSGINTSTMVSDFTKPANSEVWAGGFATPDPPSIILTEATDVCINVWFNEPGNLALKLENGNQDNWIQTKEVTETQTWVQLCYNTLEASEEAPFAPAAGGTYNGLALFFDFGQVLDAERTYYLDDVITQISNAEPADITFSVDMNEYEGDFTTPFVSGTFNEWSPDANPMSDADGDGVWTVTINDIASGQHEYKFQLDGWMAQDNFNGNETCTITDPSGQFVNRRLIVTADETLPTVCFNSCFACGEGVRITVNLGTSHIMVSEEGVFIAGGSNFGIPGDFPLLDEDGDDVYSIVLERPIGFESFYTFANGACGDFSCKENIGGQDCADPDNFNDRKMGPLMEDTVINTCFGFCTETTDCGDISSANITYTVDMSNYTETFTQVYISGAFNGWSGDANPLTDNGDGTWSITLSKSPGTYDYKFQLDNWAIQEEFTDGDPCTVTDPSGPFVNRVITVEEDDAAVCFFWNTCDDCEDVGLFDVNVDNSIFDLQSNLVNNETQITFGNSFYNEKTLSVFNAFGQKVKAMKIQGGNAAYILTVNDLEQGIYFINISTEGKQQTRKIVVHR